MKKGLVTAAALGSPIVWFASHAAQFALSPLTCPWRSNAILWMVAAVALVLDAVCGYFAWMQWGVRPERGGRLAVMPRWLALAGVVLSGGFFVVIIAQAIPSLMLGGCD